MARVRSPPADGTRAISCLMVPAQLWRTTVCACVCAGLTAQSLLPHLLGYAEKPVHDTVWAHLPRSVHQDRAPDQEQCQQLSGLLDGAGGLRRQGGLVSAPAAARTVLMQLNDHGGGDLVVMRAVSVDHKEERQPAVLHALTSDAAHARDRFRYDRWSTSTATSLPAI